MTYQSWCIKFDPKNQMWSWRNFFLKKKWSTMFWAFINIDWVALYEKYYALWEFLFESFAKDICVKSLFSAIWLVAGWPIRFCKNLWMKMRKNDYKLKCCTYFTRSYLGKLDSKSSDVIPWLCSKQQRRVNNEVTVLHWSCSGAFIDKHIQLI